MARGEFSVATAFFHDMTCTTLGCPSRQQVTSKTTTLIKNSRLWEDDSYGFPKFVHLLTKTNFAAVFWTASSAIANALLTIWITVRPGWGGSRPIHTTWCSAGRARKLLFVKNVSTHATFITYTYTHTHTYLYIYIYTHIIHVHYARGEFCYNHPHNEVLNYKSKEALKKEGKNIHECMHFDPYIYHPVLFLAWKTREPDKSSVKAATTTLPFASSAKVVNLLYPKMLLTQRPGVVIKCKEMNKWTFDEGGRWSAIQFPQDWGLV